MFLGVDAGSAYIKYALLSENRQIKGLEKRPNIGNEYKLTNERIDAFLLKQGQSRVNTVISACGYGSKNVENTSLINTEITAIAKGVSVFGKDVECIVDIGAQDFKVIRSSPSSGKVLQFHMNDKCSSGTGEFMSMITHKLGISFDEMDGHYFSKDKAVKLSRICSVFATSEVVGHLASGCSVDSILKGAIDVLVERIVPLTRRFDNIKTFTLTGGLSNTDCIVDAFRKAVNLEYVPIKYSDYIGAVGMAALAAEKEELL